MVRQIPISEYKQLFYDAYPVGYIPAPAPG